MFVYWQDGRDAGESSVMDLYFAEVSPDAPATNRPVDNEQTGGNQGSAVPGVDCGGHPHILPTDDGGTDPRVRHSALPDSLQEK